MNIKIISVGKRHDPAYDEKISEYEKRLKSFCRIEWLLVPSGDIEKESAKILKAIKQDDYVILLDERGVQINNQQLASALEKLQSRSKNLVVVIGGAYGVDNNVRLRANNILSLSKLVLPHQIVRLVAVEQIYRSFSILSGSKYHHE